MSRQVFVSDTHFGHRAILSPRMRNPRLFASIDEHDETLIANWNAVVRPDDTIWHLGDFCYRCSEDYARSVFSRLRGRNRFLLKGNHDRISVRLPWDGIFDVARVAAPDPATGATVGLFLFHYACRVWDRMHRGDLHLYEHSYLDSLYGQQSVSLEPC